MGITRTGKHYPKPEWAIWRDDVVRQILNQWNGKPIDKPCKIVVIVTNGDKRRRDVPGMLDALWHCLEKARVVTDDKLLADVKFTQYFERGKQKVEIRIF